jgi:cytochrome P450
VQPSALHAAHRPLGRQLGLAFAATFVRNPLEVIPQAAYEEDFVPAGVGGSRIWVTSPALIKAVLLDERDKFQKLTQIRLLRPLIGRGILTSEGAEWKWQRQASAPMFRPQELGGFVPAFVRVTQELLERWRQAPRGSTQPIDKDMTRSTFDVISATLLPSATWRPSSVDEPVPEIGRMGTALCRDERCPGGCPTRLHLGHARDLHAATRSRR